MCDYPILGMMELTGADRATSVNGVYKSITDSNGIVAACFNPRHGLRAQKGTTTVDVIICFECYSLVVNENGERAASIPIMDSAPPVLTKLLNNAGIEVAKKNY